MISSAQQSRISRFIRLSSRNLFYSLIILMVNYFAAKQFQEQAGYLLRLPFSMKSIGKFRVAPGFPVPPRNSIPEKAEKGQRLKRREIRPVRDTLEPEIA